MEMDGACCYGLYVYTQEAASLSVLCRNGLYSFPSVVNTMMWEKMGAGGEFHGVEVGRHAPCTTFVSYPSHVTLSLTPDWVTH